jgi:flagellin
MSTRINTNIEAFNAQRNLSLTATQYGKSVEKLSSGLRINRAGDDAAGLSISEKLRAQIKGLGQAQRNAQDGISMIQTGEGALNETHSMLQRMRELMVQASNDTLSSSDRSAIQAELGQLGQEVDGISARTKFNGQALLTGNLATTRSAGNLNNGTSATAGGGGNTTSIAISNLNVTNAAAGQTYTLTAVGAALTLTSGGATPVAQTATVTLAGNGAQTFSFDKLGVSFTVTGTSSAGTSATAANIASTLAASMTSVTTAAGSGSANFQVGSDASQTMAVSFAKVDGTTLGLDAVANDSASLAQTAAGSSATATTFLTTLDNAIQAVSDQRGVLGASQNRLEHTIANLGVSQENLTASESRIRDVDMAAEMVNFTKTGILQQAGQAILSQANSAPQGILSLLKG